jgi:hypothetical protein
MWVDGDGGHRDRMRAALPQERAQAAAVGAAAARLRRRERHSAAGERRGLGKRLRHFLQRQGAARNAEKIIHFPLLLREGSTAQLFVYGSGDCRDENSEVANTVDN